jgi:hypothetical protein
MDYLDHKKEIRQRIILFVGYALVGLAIIIATVVLWYQSYGYGVNKKGDVIQNGLTFFSSHPNPANIYLNGKPSNSTTNTRLSVAAGVYSIKLTRDGYYDWQRNIEVVGGDVQHFDYPLLFPKTVTTKNIQNLTSPPGIVTQSPDHRWLLIQSTPSLLQFNLYDLKNPDKAAVGVSLPASILAKATNSENWLLVEWATDNRHVVLRHNYDNKTEYILVDRDQPSLSINLNANLGINPTKLTLNDRKYDQYYIYDAATFSLARTSLKTPISSPVLQHVLAYKTYGNDTVLYVTDHGSAPGRVGLKLMVGNSTYQIRTLSAGSDYLLDLTKYGGVMYVVAGAASDNRVYVYRDPIRQLQSQPKLPAAFAHVLHVDKPNYVSFSSNAQFIVAENGNKFGVYDIENKAGYHYTTTQPLDSPQLHATWMDGHRLNYVSGGRLNVFDYDYLNLRSFVAQDANYLPAFSPNYKLVHTITAAPTAGQLSLSQTSLLAPADR